MSPQPLLIADGPALLYRAFFALPDSITDDDGAPVNALLGSANALLQVVEERSPRAVVVCFGQEDAAHRVGAFPRYHADRPPMPAALRHQWERAGELYGALNFAVRGHASLEADDLLGSLAAIEQEAGGTALILTGDRDMFQCATARVTVLLQRTGARGGPVVMGPEEIEAEYGIPPALVPDFIALRGDPSDGIPGGKGIGAKTAADLLQRHGSLEAALDDPVRERPAVRAALIGQRDELLLFKALAQLVRVELERPPDAPLDRERGAQAAERLGMRRLAERLRGS